MYYKATGIFEGGAMRGVYTAGVLDVLMDQDIWFSHVIGVSAGAANALNYAAGQKGRTLKCMALENKKLRYFGWESIRRTGHFYDFEMCFQTFADLHIPFDYDAFANSPIVCEAVVTDVTSGEPVYIRCRPEDKQEVIAARASSSLPFLTKPYPCDGYLCLDGGITDSIPFDYAQTFGNEKRVVILTKPHGYRKDPPNSVVRMLTVLKYHRYPKLADAMNSRFRMYNRQMALLEDLERQGKIFVFQPQKLYVGHMEQDPEKLKVAYRAGVEDATRRLEELKAYLES